MKYPFLLLLLVLSACTTTRNQRQTERYYARRPELATAALAMKTAKLRQDSLAAAVPPLVCVDENAGSSPANTKANLSRRSISRANDIAVYTSSRDASAAPAKTGFIGRLFGKKTALNTQGKPISGASLRKCKGCTIVYGTATVNSVSKKATAAIGEAATAAVTGKKSGPAAIASDSATLNTAAANAQQTITTGTGNQVAAKKQDTQQESPSPLAVVANNLTSWIPYAAGGLVLLLVFVLWRKKKQAENLIN